MGPSAIVLYGCAAVFLALLLTTVAYLLVRLYRHYQQSNAKNSKGLPLYEAPTQEMLHPRLTFKLAKAE